MSGARVLSSSALWFPFIARLLFRILIIISPDGFEGGRESFFFFPRPANANDSTSTVSVVMGIKPQSY